MTLRSPATLKRPSCSSLPEIPEIPLIRAIAAHTRGLVQGNPADLVEAANGLRMTQRPLCSPQRPRTAGAALALCGPPHEAVLLLTQALDTYLDCEAGADARRVKRLLRHSGVRRHVPARSRPTSGWESLTDSELRVARLVAQGSTNRDARGQAVSLTSHCEHAFTQHLRKARHQLSGRLGRVSQSRTATWAMRSPII